ncbi:MAG: hypothetical protein IPI41_12210 [Flavobacteriales bacterium]|nr:hypothetical protein [Flavobacteriales bacterium]
MEDALPKTSAKATEQKGGSVLENAEKLKKLKELYDAQILEQGGVRSREKEDPGR